MKWLTDWLRHVGQILSGKADWLDNQEEEIRERFAAFNATVRKLLGIAFVAGVAAGWLFHGFLTG
ncbi:hypothetical protein [Anaeroselena agilis]|uniref:Uncharacterized protein n=1 Tax=Anaeroselena agilis TaxID=3063788 RepID=A0ABU3NX57_9FIRM|nr:hypothetical protein [Selenomonadales bacterium 4137-cl]